MEVPVVSVVGLSGSGKTTLIEKLLPELSRRGYKVATIKHAEEIDLVPDKDSDRHLKAGSNLTVVAAPEQVVMFLPTTQPATLEEVAHLLDGRFDIVLCEGYKHANLPKIEVHSRAGEPLLEGITNVVAVVTSEPLDTQLKQFSFDDVEGIVDFIEENFIKPQDECFELCVNGKPIPLKDFVSQIFSQTITAMVSCLKGVNSVEYLEIKMRRNNRGEG